MSPEAQSVVSQAMSSLHQVDVPPILEDRIAKHQTHLMCLASTLFAGGQDTDQVRQTIEEVLESFKGELLKTIASLMENNDAV